jgi:hypothetical protein
MRIRLGRCDAGDPHASRPSNYAATTTVGNGWKDAVGWAPTNQVLICKRGYRTYALKKKASSEMATHFRHFEEGFGGVCLG